jgi:hypothetical protein
LRSTITHILSSISQSFMSNRGVWKFGQFSSAPPIFMSVLMNYVAGPHRPLRRQPISVFPDVGMLRNPPRLSILTGMGGGGEREVRNELLAWLLLSVWKIMWDSPTGHFGGSPYPAFWMWACSETLPVYRYCRGGVAGARRGWETSCLLVFCCLFWKIVAFHIRVSSWPVTAELITPFPFRGRIRPLD